MSNPLELSDKFNVDHQSSRATLLGSVDFRRIVYATLLYCFGISGFLFLYNLFLLDHGFLEASIGVLASATVLGTMTGTLPIGFLASKYGTRRVMVSCLWLIAFIFAAKLLTSSLPLQFVLDLLGGFCVAGWVVGLAPLVAETVEEGQTAASLSILFSASIVSCAAAAFIGGRLPGLLQELGMADGFSLSAPRSKQCSMFILCIIGALAAVPLMRLKSDDRLVQATSTWKIDSFLWRFLLVNAIWALAIGCLNPFMTVFLTRKMGVTLPHLGGFFSFAQALQAIVLLASPWLLRRFSLLASIVTTQLGAAFALFTLAVTHSWTQAALPLTLFMLAQHIVDPNMQTFLMNSTAPNSRNNASAMYLLTVSLSQVAAGALAGCAIARYGYAAVFIAAAVLATLASISLFTAFEMNVPSPSAAEQISQA